MNEFKETNRKYLFYPMLLFVIGTLMGYGICLSNKSTKKYPIEVTTNYKCDNHWYLKYMEADSVKGDTIWKDGLNIVNKIIINVNFK